MGVDAMGVDKVGVDEIGVDEMGSRRSGNKPYVMPFLIFLTIILIYPCIDETGQVLPYYGSRYQQLYLSI